MPKSPLQARPGRPGSDRHPGFLAFVAALWVVVGILELTALKGFGYHIAAGIIFIGVGLLFARGALVGFLRMKGTDVPAPELRGNNRRRR